MYYEIEFYITPFILFRQEFEKDCVVYHTEILTRHTEDEPFTHYISYTPEKMKENPFLINDIVKEYTQNENIWM